MAGNGWDLELELRMRNSDVKLCWPGLESHWMAIGLDLSPREVMIPSIKKNLCYQVWNLSVLEVRGA